MVLEPDSTKPPPQISSMFSKFALALKTKTVEFFAEDEQEEEDYDEESSSEQVIKGQRVVVIKPDTTPIPKHIHRNLISSLFATISSFEASYLQLQTAHSPFDSGNIKIADESLVSSLQKCSEIKRNYGDYIKRSNPRLNPPKFPFGSQYEAQVNENQSVLRTLGLLVNRLQLEIDVKDCEVSSMKQELDGIEKENVKLLNVKSKLKSKSCSGGEEEDDVLLSIDLFDSVLRDACRAAHRFCKCLIDSMEKVGWDLKLAADSVYPNVEYAKNGHTRFAFLSYVFLEMFRGFDLDGFGIQGGNHDFNGGGGGGDRKFYLRQFVEHGRVDALEMLRKNPNCGFAKFCENKYRQLIHPTMESSLFKNMDRNEFILNSWKSSASFYESFIDMANLIWMLHKLAFSFDPVVEIFQVEQGVDFSMVYMENIMKKSSSTGATRGKVGFTVIPGFKIGCTVIQCQVYLT